MQRLKFNPDQDGTFIKRHVGLEEADRVHLVKTCAGGASLG